MTYQKIALQVGQKYQTVVSIVKKFRDYNGILSFENKRAGRKSILNEEMNNKLTD